MSKKIYYNKKNRMEMWLARDRSGSLFLFIGDRPIKEDKEWMPLGESDSVYLNKDIFPEVKWSDSEPTKVKLEIVKQ